jgi:hypothetical protein
MSCKRLVQLPKLVSHGHSCCKCDWPPLLTHLGRHERPCRSFSMPQELEEEANRLCQRYCLLPFQSTLSSRQSATQALCIVPWAHHSALLQQGKEWQVAWPPTLCC